MTTSSVTASAETSGSTTSEIEPVGLETSATTSEEYSYRSIIPTTTLSQRWTTSTNSTGTEFLTTLATGTTATLTQEWSTATGIGTTNIGNAAALGMAATVVRAEDSEVLYSFIPATNWAGFQDARAVAASTTRFTLVPNVALSSMASVTVENETKTLGNSSRSWSVEASTYLTSFKTTTSTATVVTLVTQTVLPNSTRTTATTAVTTSQRNSSVEVWPSSSDSHTKGDGTTAAVTEWETSHIEPGTSYLGNLSWHVPRETFFSTTFTKKAPVLVNGRTSSSGSYSLIDLNTTNADSFSSEIGETVDANTYKEMEPACGTMAGGLTSAGKFGPKAARLGTSSGFWFSANAATTLQFRTVRDGRSGCSTVNPIEPVLAATYSATVVSYRLDTTTTTAAIEVAGPSTTAVISDKPISVWGGTPGSRETFANAVDAAGVYQDLVGGSTFSFLPGATSFSSAQPLSKITSVTAISPPSGGGGFTQETVFWAVPKNTTGIPPILPPEAITDEN
jgi:hypothetical protein